MSAGAATGSPSAMPISCGWCAGGRRSDRLLASKSSPMVGSSTCSATVGAPGSTMLSIETSEARDFSSAASSSSPAAAPVSPSMGGGGGLLGALTTFFKQCHFSATTSFPMTTGGVGSGGSRCSGTSAAPHGFPARGFFCSLGGEAGRASPYMFFGRFFCFSHNVGATVLKDAAFFSSGTLASSSNPSPLAAAASSSARACTSAALSAGAAIVISPASTMRWFSSWGMSRMSFTVHTNLPTQ